MFKSENISSKYYSSLSRIFSPIVIDNLIMKGESDYFNEVIRCSNISSQIDIKMTMSCFFDNLYDLLSSNYCNEYIYKNVIAKQLYLGEHFDDSHMITELRVADCKADVVILNGTSTVYEIKSELDSFDRLANQIRAYLNVFDMINVITSNSQVRKLENQLPVGVGLLTLSSDNTIDTVRKPKSNKNNVNPSIIFDSLRKKEYLAIIKNKFGYIPDVPNTQIHKICKKLFCDLSANKAHNVMLNVLKDRDNSKPIRDFISNAPYSLKAYAVSSLTNDTKIHKMKYLLNQSVNSVLYSNIS